MKANIKIDVTGKNGKTYSRYVSSVNEYTKTGFAIAFVDGSHRQYIRSANTGLWTYSPF